MKSGWRKKMIAPWFSAYEENNYGELFYALTRIYQPRKVVELGTKAGYSAYYIAKALKANGTGSLDCYDLWEKYKFNSVPKSVAEKNLKQFKDIATLRLADDASVATKYKTVDILHIDMGNHGEILEAVVPKWINKVRQLIIIEGGSPERDQVDWMKKYKKQSLAKWLNDFKKRHKNIETFTIDKFPSITLIRKRT